MDLIGMLSDVSPAHEHSKQGQLYETGVNYALNFEKKWDGHQFTFSCDGPENIFDGFRKVLRETDEIFKKIRHELTASMAAKDTDVKLWKIDPNYVKENHKDWHNMSPDGWLPETRDVIELGTKASSDPNGLFRDFDWKIAKYSNYLEVCEVRYFYAVVVGPNSIVSNLPLTQTQVDILTARCRLGLAIEASIIDTLGYSPFTDGEDTNEKFEIVENIFKNFPKTTFSDPDFNRDLCNIGLVEMTEAETKRAQDLLLSSFQQTKNAERSSPKEAVDYLGRFTAENSRRKDDLKRVCNFPFVLAYRGEDDLYNQLEAPSMEEISSLPTGLREVWGECFDKEAHKPLNDDEKIEALESERFATDSKEKHKVKRHHMFSPKLSEEARIALALSGVSAKSMSGRDEIKDKSEKSHLSFHPDADTKDIEQFLKGSTLTSAYTNLRPDEMMLFRLLNTSKEFASDRNEKLNSVDVFMKYVYRSELVCFADLISCIMSEVAIVSKHYTKGTQFAFRYLRYYRVGLVVKNTGTHTFVSLCYEKNACQKIDTGRLGPTLHETDRYIFSDWASFDGTHIEHYIKAGPLMAAVMCHMMSTCEVDVIDRDVDVFFSTFHNTAYWEQVKMCLLVFLTNKEDSANLLVDQRYFFMNILDAVNPDPYRFVKRLPEVLRSRLTSLLVRRSLENMEYYAVNGVKRRVDKNAGMGSPIDFMNLRSITCSRAMPFSMILDSFYFGYMNSRDKATTAQNAYKICKKLFAEEFKYLRNREAGVRIMQDNDTPVHHSSSIPVMKMMLVIFEKIMKKKIGPNHREMTKREILMKLSRLNFSDLATLKATARPDKGSMDNTGKLDKDMSFSEIKKEIREERADKVRSRPKVLEEISEISEEYERTTGSKLSHIMELAPWVMKRLEEKGYFNSDLVAKAQLGIREIHILEISARILQYIIETISRVVCNHFQSETEISESAGIHYEIDVDEKEYYFIRLSEM